MNDSVIPRQSPGRTTIKVYGEGIDYALPLLSRDGKVRLLAIGRNVLIEPDPVPAETVSPGGIVLAQEKESYDGLHKVIYGRVVSIGNGGDNEDGDFEKPPSELLDQRVGYKKINVKEVPHDGQTFHALDFDDIICMEVDEKESPDGPAEKKHEA